MSLFERIEKGEKRVEKPIRVRLDELGEGIGGDLEHIWVAREQVIANFLENFQHIIERLGWRNGVPEITPELVSEAEREGQEEEVFVAMETTELKTRAVGEKVTGFSAFKGLPQVFWGFEGLSGGQGGGGQGGGGLRDL